MFTSTDNLKEYLIPGKHVHLIGIGGVSMRPLGLVLRSMGIRVSGSDMNSSVSFDELEKAGISVSIGHKALNIVGADCIIRTAAAHNDNPEIQAARESGIPVFERAQAWGYIMKQYPNAACISGTHGKTTTTSMLTHIAMEAELDPTVMIGGYLPLLNAAHRVGKGDLIIAESCEYCNSFLNFYPTIAVINNIEEDHLDFFSGLSDIQASFRKFAMLLPNWGSLIVNGDDANTLEAVKGLSYIRFGLSEENDIIAENISNDNREYDVYIHGEFFTHVKLQVYGLHNVYNSLAAVAASYVLKVPADKIRLGLESFCGAGRRMEFKGKYHGADVYDDYAHHPGELKTLIDTAKSMGYRRIICAFQPHTYSRTAALKERFIEELKRVDVAILAEIYAAREANTIGIGSQDLQTHIPNSVYCPTLPAVTAKLKQLASPGDLILTVGAGDIYKAGNAIFRDE